MLFIFNFLHLNPLITLGVSTPPESCHQTVAPDSNIGPRVIGCQAPSDIAFLAQPECNPEVFFLDRNLCFRLHFVIVVGL